MTRKKLASLVVGSAVATALCMSPSLAHATRPALKWFRIHVYHIAPTTVFDKLGFTHITRYGDNLGSSKTDPDPTFPTGLTDVVPYDKGHILLVRGTHAALENFQRSVWKLDVVDKEVSCTVALVQREDRHEPVTLASSDIKVLSPRETTVTIPAAQARTFGITITPEQPDTYGVSLREKVVIKPSSIVGLLLPSDAWTPKIIKVGHTGQTVEFDDPSSTMPTSVNHMFVDVTVVGAATPSPASTDSHSVAPSDGINPSRVIIPISPMQPEATGPEQKQ